MAVSLNLPTLPNLYCNEAASEVVSLEADDDECEIVTFASSDSNSIIDYDDDSLINMFDSEVDQMLESKVLSRFYDLPDIVNARQEAVQWMLKVPGIFLNFFSSSFLLLIMQLFKKFQVHSFYRFRPETAYLSINYLDRFLSARAMPVFYRPWCLSIVFCLRHSNYYFVGYKKSLKIIYSDLVEFLSSCVARERVAYAAFISIMPFSSSKNGGNNRSLSPRLANNKTQILV